MSEYDQALLAWEEERWREYGERLAEEEEE